MRFTSRPQDHAFRFELNYHSRFRFYVTITCTIVQTLFLNHPIDINTFFFYRLQKLRKQKTRSLAKTPRTLLKAMVTVY